MNVSASKILIIDDDSALREQVADILQLQSYLVLEADNGQLGVELARHNQPDLIICDIAMPHLDGYQTLHQLRLDSRTAHIPVIFLTAFSDHQHQRQGMQWGADDYLTKPLMAQDLLTAVAAQLHKHHQVALARALTTAQAKMQAIEAEKRSLAHVLQQESQATLIGMRLLLKATQAIPLATFEAALDQLLEQQQQLIAALYPTMLDQLGLLPTLLWQLDQAQNRTRIPIQLEHYHLELISTPSVSLGVYRALQQLYDQMVGHVTHVTLHLWATEALVQLDARMQLVFPPPPQAWHEQLIESLHDRLLSLNGQLRLIQPSQDQAILHWQIPLMPTSAPSASPQALIPLSSPVSHSDPSDQKVTILIADPNEIIRAGLRRIIESAGNYRIVGEASYGPDVLEQVHSLTPQIIILDMLMPHLSGLHITRALQAYPWKPFILMLSTQLEQAYVLEALRAGVTGYILKQTSRDDLVGAIASVARGERYLSHLISEHALNAYLNERLAENPHLDSYMTLTQREKEVFQLLAEGYKNAQIAQHLSISPRTAETHRANLMRKLGLESQVDLVRYAIQRGLIPLQPSVSTLIP